ncbi:Ankyrin repeat protein [Aspergillus sclerotialis]|uniref:Ankyrin repeat protein n=1 Tax=Aspergillus sclerotialis TaxID=2070753 RepID=A0A3A2Z3R1_9EURO|nr:Ankyrin repeat protein [Aspergillus sclerotialis]
MTQGGLDLSSVLMQRRELLETSARGLYNLNAPELAWQVYRLCERSSLAAFAEAATDVASMYMGLRMLKDRLETDTYSFSNTDGIRTVLQDCCKTLDGLHSTLNVYQSMPQSSRAPWNNVSSYEDFYGLKQLRL